MNENIVVQALIEKYYYEEMKLRIEDLQKKDKNYRFGDSSRKKSVNIDSSINKNE